MCSSDDDFIIKTLNNTILKMVSGYVYLGSYIPASEKDFLTRKGMAWSACNALHKIWSSNLSRATQDQNLQSSYRTNPSVWFRNMDAVQKPRKMVGWNFHPSSNENPKPLMETPSNQATNIRDHTTRLKHCQGTEAPVCWSLL